MMRRGILNLDGNIRDFLGYLGDITVSGFGGGGGAKARERNLPVMRRLESEIMFLPQ